MAANRSRGDGRGTKSGRGKGRGTKAGMNIGRRRGTPAGTPGSSVRDMRSSTSGGPKKKSTSMMRKATWDRLSGKEKMQYGTLSYKKYKADMEAMRAKNNRPQRGGGEGRGKGGGPDG